MTDPRPRFVLASSKDPETHFIIDLDGYKVLAICTTLPMADEALKGAQGKSGALNIFGDWNRPLGHGFADLP